MLEEEYPRIDFVHRDENGVVDFRDSLTFASITELRNTSKSEREAMMDERYQNWLIVRSTPGEVTEEE